MITDGEMRYTAHIHRGTSAARCNEAKKQENYLFGMGDLQFSLPFIIVTFYFIC